VCFSETGPALILVADEIPRGVRRHEIGVLAAVEMFSDGMVDIAFAGDCVAERRLDVIAADQLRLLLDVAEDAPLGACTVTITPRPAEPIETTLTVLESLEQQTPLIAELLPMSGNDDIAREYLELYNPMPAAIDLHGYTVETPYTSHTLDATNGRTTIPSGGRLVLA